MIPKDHPYMLELAWIVDKKRKAICPSCKSHIEIGKELHISQHREKCKFIERGIQSDRRFGHNRIVME